MMNINEKSLKIQKIVYLTKYALKINHHSHKKLNLYNYLHCYRFVNAIPFVDDRGSFLCEKGGENVPFKILPIRPEIRQV